jgi:DNA phosphorothioation-dependent restriction protein DptG
MREDFCSITNLTNIIKKNKEKGLKNPRIIKELTKRGCCFRAIFDAMDKTTKN